MLLDHHLTSIGYEPTWLRWQDCTNTSLKTEKLLGWPGSSHHWWGFSFNHCVPMMGLGLPWTKIEEYRHHMKNSLQSQYLLSTKSACVFMFWVQKLCPTNLIISQVLFLVIQIIFPGKLIRARGRMPMLFNFSLSPFLTTHFWCNTIMFNEMFHCSESSCCVLF